MTFHTEDASASGIYTDLNTPVFDTTVSSQQMWISMVIILPFFRHRFSSAIFVTYRTSVLVHIYSSVYMIPYISECVRTSIISSSFASFLPYSAFHPVSVIKCFCHHTIIFSHPSVVFRLSFSVTGQVNVEQTLDGRLGQVIVSLPVRQPA